MYTEIIATLASLFIGAVWRTLVMSGNHKKQLEDHQLRIASLKDSHSKLWKADRLRERKVAEFEIRLKQAESLLEDAKKSMTQLSDTIGDDISELRRDSQADLHSRLGELKQDIRELRSGR